MTRFPCPICDAPAHRREGLRDGFELCTSCGYAIRLDEQGRLVGWATTNKSHPRGVWALRATAGLVVAIMLSAVLTGCAAARAGGAAPAAPAPRAVVFGDELAGDVRICVPLQLPTPRVPFACMTLGDLRRQLRSQRVARNPFTEGEDHAFEAR